jgi:hypothetical protein
MRVTPGPLGPSTGWLAAKLGPNLKDHSRVLKQADATAVEMVAVGQDRIQAMLRGLIEAPQLYTSLHLAFPPSSSQSLSLASGEDGLLDDLADIVRNHGIRAAPLHPPQVSPVMCKALQNRDIPFAIENMDRNSPNGQSAKEIQNLMAEFGTPGVLDVQHAYEISKDNSGNGIDLSRHLAEAMMQEGGIAHLHVSGERSLRGKQTENHAQIHVATNRREIVEAVRQILDIAGPTPVILEGEYLPDVEYDYEPRDEAEREELLDRAADDMRRERECLLNELKE